MPRGLASAPLPLSAPRMPMYLARHLCRQHDPLHRRPHETPQAVARDCPA
jgi:hypothetical protein